jgi:hypothetical protein
VLALFALAAVAAPTPAGASTSASAQSEYQSALNAAGGKGVHFASSASQQGVSFSVQGDTGTSSGLQTLTVQKKGSPSEHVTAMVVGSTGYLKGNAAALHSVIGLTATQSRTYAGTWLSFPTSNSALAELVSGLLNAQVAGELEMSGPFSYGTTTTVSGQRALAVRGYVGTESGGKVPVVLYVTASGPPLPMEEVTNPGGTGGATAVHGTVIFTHWGENATETAPARSVSLLKLAPPSASGTTTTGG